jgi:hypothetical protein
MNTLERVRQELAKYEHPLVEFFAEEGSLGVELRMRVKGGIEGIHVYSAPVHERDAASPQFEWQFQRYLYDCLHDYLVEMFTLNPQRKDSQA